jgi:hypothetical protein
MKRPFSMTPVSGLYTRSRINGELRLSLGVLGVLGGRPGLPEDAGRLRERHVHAVGGLQFDCATIEA